MSHENQNFHLSLFVKGGALQRTPPNQVTYLKESSIESFTLGPTPKIDFSFNTATAHNGNG
jgi:hypothetical protein